MTTEKKPDEIEVYVWRHGAQENIKDGSSWEPKAPLNIEGRQTIQCVIDKNLKGVNFKICGSSGFVRAKQTIQMYTDKFEVIKGLEPVSQLAWELLDKQAPKLANSSIVEMYQNLTGAILLTSEADHMLNTIKEVAAKLYTGEKALLASHEPLINAALNMARGDWTSQINLKKGEIIVFRFNKNLNFLGFRHIALP